MKRLLTLAVLLLGASALALGGPSARSTDMTTLQPGLSAGLVASSDDGVAASVSRTQPVADSPAASSFPAAPRIHMEPAQGVPARFAGPERAVEALRERKVRALSLASADFDEDGVPDVLSGFRSGRSGILVLQRGNVDAIYPNAPEARERRRQGTFADAAFLPDARVFETPEPPNFLGAGDFDADGHWDVVTASRTRPQLLWHAGDGRGGFGSAMAIALPGNPTALVTGEINRRDGLDDVIAAVMGPDGPEALVFESPEGALQRAPERFGLPATATSLALGQMDEHSSRDLLVAAGQTLVFVRGRDRRLSVALPGKPEGAPAQVERIDLPFTVTSVTSGRASGGGAAEIALMTASGAVYAAPLAAILRSAREGVSAEKALGERLHAGAPNGLLLRASVSSLPGDDFLVVDPDVGEIVVASPANRHGRAPTRGAIDPMATSNDPPPLAAFPTGKAPAALLAMRLNDDAASDLVVLAEDASGLAVVPTGPLAVYTVNTTADTNDGACTAAHCTLREAIAAANGNPGSDTIGFAIPGAGHHVIRPATGLPDILDSVTIDGSTQPGFAGTPVVVLDGSLLSTAAASGLWFQGGNSVVRSLSFIHFIEPGVSAEAIRCLTPVTIEGNYFGIDPAGATGPNFVGILDYSSGSVIGGTVPAARNIISASVVTGIITLGDSLAVLGNHIGTNPAGTAPLPNDTGIEGDNADQTVGGTAAGSRNVISGNTTGIRISKRGTGGMLVQGNFIGTAASGLAPLPNEIYGVQIYDFDGLAADATIGGTSPAARNIISGNGASAIVLLGSWTLVQGNYIGLGADGSTLIPNSQGVELFRTAWEVTHNTVGGTTPGARNVIAGGTSGVHIAGGELNIIAGNYIGTNATGTLARPNHDGVWLDEGALNNVIGQPGGVNVISGNSGAGIVIHDIGAQIIANNYIGVAQNGFTPLGNAGDGIRIHDSEGNLIGGFDETNLNIIAHNGGDGISIRAVDATGNSIVTNAIYGNGGLGIDLPPAGPDVNDHLDPDGGANHGQNYPVLTLAETNGATVRVDGTLDSKPLSDFNIRVYATETCDPSGYGEGKFFLGRVTVSTDAAGLATFSQTFTAPAAVGEAVTATANHSGDASEFSACASVVGVSPAAVTGFKFSGTDTLDWDAMPGASAYHVYVGTPATLPGLATQAPDSCQAALLTETGGTLPPGAAPPPGQMFWFLITAEGQYGEGPVAPGNPGPRLLTSAGGCEDSCVHDPCVVGTALLPACTLKAGFVCSADPKCCDPVNGTWDFKCVQEVRTVGRSLACAESQGQCPHMLCDTGSPLPPGCDTPPLPVSCTAAVCQADPHCCQQTWDEACIATMARVCGYNCV